MEDNSWKLKKELLRALDALVSPDRWDVPALIEEIEQVIKETEREAI